MTASQSPFSVSDPVYADYNGTTPVDPRVFDAMVPFLSAHFGNPSSSHGFGTAPAEAVALARARIASLIGAASDDEIVFTGSGTEADHLAIRGVLRAALSTSDTGGPNPATGSRTAEARPHIVIQETEHPAVLAAAEVVAENGVDVTTLPVDSDGLVGTASLARALRPSTVLVSIMHANNETGAIQPIAALARTARAAGVLFHTDAAQSVGKVPVDVDELGVDLLTVVGHKLYAPKGVGALYVRAGTRIQALLPGGGQEGGLRGGTENVAGIVAFGEAARLAGEDLGGGGPERMRRLRDELEAGLAELLPGRVLLNGPRDARLPQTLNVSIAGARGVDVLSGTASVAASTGSACHAGTDAPSPVLTAMGMGGGRAMGALRLSLGRWTTAEDVRRIAEALAAQVDRG